MNEKGFTLVETLVSLVVGAMLLGSISWVISGLGKDFKTSQQSNIPRQQMQSAKLLSRILSDARFVDAAGNPLPRSDDRLDFMMRAPEALGMKGFVPARLQAAGMGGAKALTLEIAGADYPKVELLGDLEKLDFDYSVNIGPQGEIPFVRQIAINFQRKAETKAQRINIRPHINAVGACIFDPISQQCRS